MILAFPNLDKHANFDKVKNICFDLRQILKCWNARILEIRFFQARMCIQVMLRPKLFS